MKKRAIDLTFEELALAGRDASEAAIYSAHANGLSTFDTDESGELIRTYPDGKTERVPSAYK